MASKVLIVILTHNSAEYIGDCLSSLKKVDYPKDDFEILLIDNASSDNTSEMVRGILPEATTIINDQNIGFAAGNNIGFKYAIDYNFDYVYLLNHDTVVQPDFLTKAVILAEVDSNIGAVQSKLLLFQDKEKINSIGNEIHYLGFAFAGGYKLADRLLKPREITYPSGACTLFRVASLIKTGVFNPEFFMYHEDTDLGWRLWLNGYKVMLAPESVVYHKYEFSRSIKKYYYMERNRYLVVFQNYKMATILLLTPAFVLMDFLMFIYSFVGGFWREELRVYGYFFDSKNWPKMFAARRMVQSNRTVKDREVMKRFTGKIEFQDLNNPLLTYIANPFFNLYWKVIKNFIWW